MGKIAFRADQYFNNSQRMDIYGDIAQPVDLNAGLVVTKSGKWGMCETCGEETEDNIRERFGLVTPDNIDNC